jgi:deoxyribose-phosphate aldolase
MNIKQYLDSTYLKTASQAGINESQNMLVVKSSFKKPLMKLQAYYDSV